MQFRSTKYKSRTNQREKTEGLDKDSTKLNASSIEVTNVNFRVNKSPYSKEERLAMANKFLENHNEVDLFTYQGMRKLSRSTAYREREAFSTTPNSGIISIGRGRSKRYIAAKY